mgnify:CR=1 FL=1
MKNNNILIGAIAVIGALTLFNTYKVLTNDGGRTIPPPTPTADIQANNQGANFPNTLPQNQNNPNNQFEQPAPQQPAAPVGPTTSINFKEPKKDFGKVLSTTTNKHTFTFTNTGTEPLVIQNAKGSCGCTVPKWPKEPIAPGAEGVITAIYNSKGRPGNFTKTITVKHNGEGGTEFLTIRGVVNKAPTEVKPTVVAPEQ